MNLILFTKRGVTQVFKNIPNHSLCDLHTILNEHTSIISIQEPSERKQIIVVFFCLFLSVDFVNILPKSGGEQILIELDPPPPCYRDKFDFVGFLIIPKLEGKSSQNNREGL